MPEAATLILAYMIGSTPIAWLIYRHRTGRDLREVGDGNVGAANAAREGAGHVAGVVIILADIGKGLLAVSIARWWHLEQGCGWLRARW